LHRLVASFRGEGFGVARLGLKYSIGWSRLNEKYEVGIVVLMILNKPKRS